MRVDVGPFTPVFGFGTEHFLGMNFFCHVSPVVCFVRNIMAWSLGTGSHPETPEGIMVGVSDSNPCGLMSNEL